MSAMLTEHQGSFHVVPAWPQQPCGCPVETSKFLYRCYQHVHPERQRTDDAWTRGAWYRENTCFFCGRVNPGGLACATEEYCKLCGLRTCDSHGQGTYKLHIICPKNINPRTKVGKALLASLRVFMAPKEAPLTDSISNKVVAEFPELGRPS